MKLLSLIILLTLAPATAAAQQQRPSGPEQRAAADPAVVVSLCLASGDVVVRGWARNEVQARTSSQGALALQTDGGQPARRVEVLVKEHGDGELHPGECGLTSGLEISVPRGATVNLRLHEGDVEVSDVAELTVSDMSGDVAARGVTRSADLSTMSGDISLADSKGRARLRAISGSVEAKNVTPVGAGDSLEATSTSGDVSLAGVGHDRVNGATISGSVRLSGALARAGTYEFKTISGDVTLALPSDSSFRLNAKVVMSGEIITDFPVRATSISDEDEDGKTPAPPTPPRRRRPGSVPPPPPPPAPDGTQSTRLVGTVGSGDASLTLSSFSGTLHLKRQ